MRYSSPAGSRGRTGRGQAAGRRTARPGRRSAVIPAPPFVSPAPAGRSGEDDRLVRVGDEPVRQMPVGHRHLPSHRESAGKLTAARGQTIKTFGQRCQVKSNPKKENRAGRIGGVSLWLSNIRASGEGKA